MFVQNAEKRRGRLDKPPQPRPQRGPQPPPQGPRHGGNAQAPHGPAQPGAGQHIQPEPSLRRLHAAHEKRRQRRQTEKAVRQRGGQARPVPQAAQKIVQQAQPRPQQEKPSGLPELRPHAQPHHLKSLAQKPVPGPVSS